MTNEQSRAAHVQRKAGEKRIYLLILFLTIGACIVAASIYFFFSIPITESVGAKAAFVTFQSDLQPMKTSLHVVGIGDSLTKGVGDQTEKGYAGLTVEALKKSSISSNVTFADYGVKGDTTGDLLKVLKKEDVRDSIKHADMVFMTIGGNDLVSVLKENLLNLNVMDFKDQRLVYQRNFNAILQTIYQLNPKVTVYYIGLYNPFEDLFPDLDPQFQSILQQWNQGSETILELFPHTVFVPTADLFKDKSSDLLYKDHFHPNKEGYHLIAKRLESVILNK